MRRAPYVVIAIYAMYLAWVVAGSQWPVVRWFWTSDDGYFYLTIARNLARGLGSTFDGLSFTNGYQPIWLAVLAAVYRVTGPLSPESGVRVAVALAGVCAVGGVLLFVRLSERISSAPAAPVAVAVGLLASVGFWFFGVEAHLTLLVAGIVLTLVWQQWERVSEPAAWSLPSSLVLASAAALLVLTRIDLVVWIVVLLLALTAARAIAGWPRTLVITAALVEQGLSAAIVVSCGAISRVWFGGWLPISAVLRAKAPGVSWRDLHFYHAIDTAQGALLVGSAVVMLVWAARRARARGLASLLTGRAGFGAILATGVLAHSLVTVLCSVSIEPRYLVMSSAATVMILAILLSEWTSLATRGRAALLNGVVLVVTALVSIQLARIAIHRAASPPDEPADLADLAEFRREAAPYLTDDAVVFAVDFSGELSWFCDCHLINGDGLVNSWTFQRFVAERRVHAFLDAARVTYVVETTGEPRDDVFWIDGYDWKARGHEAFPIVGYRPASALVHVGQFRLFRYPDGAMVPPERAPASAR